MVVFKILKILAQILGVFPFRQKKTFYISKVFFIVNVFVGFSLVVFGIFAAHNTWCERINFQEFSPNGNVHPLNFVMYKFWKVILFGQVITSFTAVITKIIWRKEHVENLNAIFEFYQEHRVNTILNATAKSDYFFIIALCVSTIAEITSTFIDMTFPLHNVYRTYSSAIQFQTILDEIMFCVFCSALAKYQRAIEQMISSCFIDKEREVIARDNTNIPEMITRDFHWSHSRQINVIERAAVSNQRQRSVSAKARKLEFIRKMNFKISNIYSNHSALHQYQLFFSTIVSTIRITTGIFELLAGFRKYYEVASTYKKLQEIKVFGFLMSSLIRIFMLCYYNDKIFNEGAAMKYILEEIIRTSSEQDLIKVSKIFMEQEHTRKHFQVCGIFAINMTLPVTFIGYAMDYVVVLVQYIGIEF